MSPPRRHRRDKLARVALRVPLAGVRVGPCPDGLRVTVIEDALHQTRIQEQSLDSVITPGAARVSGLTVEVEFFAHNADHGAARSDTVRGCRLVRVGATGPK